MSLMDWMHCIGRGESYAATRGSGRRASRAGTRVLPRNVAVGKLPDAVLYTGRRGAQPGVKRPTTHSAFKFLVHDFVHRRRAYRGFSGSCVRIFSISYVLSIGVYRSIPAAGTTFQKLTQYLKACIRRFGHVRRTK